MSVDHVAVLGAGVMGSAIAQTLAASGFTTTCYDVSPEQLARARRHAGGTNGRLTFTESLAKAVARAEVVVESVVEDLEVKVRLFRELDRLTPRTAVLASNTSGYSIAALAGATDRPDRVIGWHWASPAPVRPLAEIVVTAQTSLETTHTIVAMAKECGKNAVVVHDNQRVWGCPSTRLFARLLEEAEAIVAEGCATRAQIDQLMVDGFAWPAGPFGARDAAAVGWQAR